MSAHGPSPMIRRAPFRLRPCQPCRSLRAGWLLLTLGIAMLPLGLVPFSGPPAARAAEGPVIAAAASMSPLLRGVAELYETRFGATPVLVFSASGNLARQIEQGAPYHAFLSADARWMARVVESGRIAAGSVRTFARARLVLVVPGAAETPLSAALGAPGTPAGPEVLARLADPAVRYIAIANPESAPFGRAAEQSLRAAGLWETLRPRLVYGENVAQAWQFVRSGNADAGLIAGPLVVSGEHPWRAVAQELYAPLDQTLGLVEGAPSGARDFLALLDEPEGHALLDRFGYAPLAPGTAPPAGEGEGS